VIIEQEKVREEDEVKQPHLFDKSKKKEDVKLLGQYEIIRDKEKGSKKEVGKKGKLESNPKQMPKGDEGVVNNENAINKITITVYQKKNGTGNNSTKNNKK